MYGRNSKTILFRDENHPELSEGSGVCENHDVGSVWKNKVESLFLDMVDNKQGLHLTNYIISGQARQFRVVIILTSRLFAPTYSCKQVTRENRGPRVRN